MTGLLQEVQQEVQQLEVIDDQINLVDKLNELKDVNINSEDISLYLVEFTPDNKIKRVSKSSHLKISASFKLDLKSYFKSLITNTSEIKFWSEINTNEDDRLFFLPIKETQFITVLDSIENAGHISGIDEMSEYNGYLIKYDFTDENNTPCFLYAMTYIATAWKIVKRKRDLKQVITFSNEGNIADISKCENQFYITPKIDFISFNDGVYIHDIKAFERAMRFKNRLIERSNVTAQELVDENFINENDKETLINVINGDGHFMRNFSSVKTLSFYKEEGWLDKLYSAITIDKMGTLEFHEDKKIKIKNDKTYIKELLVLLQDKRVTTVISKRTCDVDGNLDQVSIQNTDQTSSV
ncbi:TPA: Kiwa anti-phage protein KwaB-like domain-containing protein [Photobacterium damselae]